jgi:hypothetical protein
MEPPQLAVWMLEHLTPVERDEALAGDLLEVFRAGRSTNWYWRQVLAACAVSWYESLRARGSLLTFALLWSMMSPTWNSLCIRLENGNPIPDRLWFISGPLWLIPALLLWTILHSLFLWTGILSFGVLNLIAKNPVSPTKIKRGFLLASAIFVPLYGATFLLVTLNWNWYSHFENWQLGNSALGELTDLRPLADAIRIPYFVALIVALWGVVPRLVRSPQLAKTELFEASDSSEPSAQIEPIDLPRAKRFLAFVAIAGLINSMISALILCRLPELHESDSRRALRQSIDVSSTMYFRRSWRILALLEKSIESLPYQISHLLRPICACQLCGMDVDTGHDPLPRAAFRGGSVGGNGGRAGPWLEPAQSDPHFVRSTSDADFGASIHRRRLVRGITVQTAD